MRRPSRIALVLMGGGLVLTGCDRESQECRDARAANRADAAQICARQSSSNGGGAHGGYSGRSRTASSSESAATHTTTTRGGFGAFMSHVFG